MASSSSNIRVVCRFRPQNRREESEGGVNVVEYADSGDTVTLQGKEFCGSFTFDQVFAPDVSQAQVFNSTVRTTVDDVLRGYNGTVFAYGQTGSGKTYTMMGANIDDEEAKGVIPRIAEQIFHGILHAPSDYEFTVKVAYLEIYMEKIRDLLNPVNDNLQIHEDKVAGVHVKDCLEVYVSSISEVLEVMRRGQSSRVVAATQMNAESSRSHSIFIMTITQKNLVDGSNRLGRLYLVDLAGSEKVGKTGASGQTLEEAKKINRSLTALGMVINALTDSKSTHVPYRDSKLTRILQESLGGNSRTTLIINASPSSFNESETLSTLRFGTRAKTIKNKAKINQELSAAELKLQLKKSESHTRTFAKYIRLLETELASWRSGEIVEPEKFIVAKDHLPATLISATTAESLAEAALNDADNEARAPSSSASLLSNNSSSSEKLDDAQPKSQELQRDKNPSDVEKSQLDDDERSKFIQFENELADELAKCESQLKISRAEATVLREELGRAKQHEQTLFKENADLNVGIQDLRLQIERQALADTETKITIDAMRHSNTELEQEIMRLTQSVQEAESLRLRNEQLEKDITKSRRMSQMMLLTSAPAATSTIAPLSEQSSSAVADASGNVGLAEMTHRYNLLRKEYNTLVEKKISSAANEAVGSDADCEIKPHVDFVKALEPDVIGKEADKYLVAEPTTSSTAAATRKALLEQTTEFDSLRSVLISDYQTRCERIVELENELVEIKAQLSEMMRSSNVLATQSKIALLERNIEQMAVVHKQLVAQNTTMKQELVVSERKLASRTDCVKTLENMMKDVQRNLSEVKMHYEERISELEHRLSEVHASNPMLSLVGGVGVGGSSGAGLGAPFGFGRVAKPVRGGMEAPSS